MTYPWSDLKFWQSGEFQLAKERINDDKKRGFGVNPSQSRMFDALSVCPLGETKVVILGQDPYPSGAFADGLAFSVPRSTEPNDYPPTLRNILSEYVKDLGYPYPPHGNLRRWAENGVLLWNTIPSCREGVSLSHDWADGCWDHLTAEIIRRCDEQGVVFAFLGAVAKRHLGEVLHGSPTICVSHPSPRGSLSSKTPFLGSRLFTAINAKLVEIGHEPVDWRLDDDAGSQTRRAGGKDLPRSRPDGKVSQIRENITGTDCGPLQNP